eukprot:s448_g2.t1
MGQVADGGDASSSAPTPSEPKEKKEKKDKSDKKDKKSKKEKKDKKSKKEKKEKARRTVPSPVNSPGDSLASPSLSAAEPPEEPLVEPLEPPSAKKVEPVAVDPPAEKAVPVAVDPPESRKNTLNAAALAVLNRANTCDLVEQGLPAEGGDSTKSEKLEISDRRNTPAEIKNLTRNIRAGQLETLFKHRYSKEEDPVGLADALFEEKVRGGLWRKHPEFPARKARSTYMQQVVIGPHSKNQIKPQLALLGFQDMFQVKVYNEEDELSESEDEREVKTSHIATDRDNNSDDEDEM